MGSESWCGVALIHLALITVQIIFSINQIASKVGTRYFNPAILICARCMLVSPLMLLLAKIKEKNILPKNRREVLLLVAMGGFSTIAFECFIFGIKLTSVATGTTLQATSPLWTLLIALALKMEGPSIMKIIGVICAIFGAAISVAGSNALRVLFGEGPDQAAPGSDKSDFPEGLLLIANAIFFSGFVTVQKLALNTIKPLTATAWNISITGFFSMFVAFFFLDTVDLGAVTLEGWLVLLYISLFAMGIAYALLAWAAKQTSTTVIAVYTTVMPVLSPIASYFYLGEQVTIIQIIGMLVTLAGVFLVIRARYVEERRARLLALQPANDATTGDVAKEYALIQPGTSDDVAKEYAPMSVVVAAEGEEENQKEKEEGENRGKLGKKGKGGYMIVTGDDVELQEVASM
eukprot:Phypoly_transcript_09611.p1 GENE.Phypoly_transcript_09611~~Phypoly_transcript_09611.p1  ORF type:complete len:405 (+),score=59.84 Phypoly_transcript_09611:172-1386(+)